MSIATLEAVASAAGIRPLGRPAPVDWGRVLVHLERHQHPRDVIAQRLGMRDARIGALPVPVGEPSFEDGEALLSLWCDVMDLPLSEVPRRR